MKSIWICAALMAIYVACFAVFRWEHASRVNTGTSARIYRTHLLVDGVNGHLLKCLFYPALLLDAHVTGRDTLFISRELWDSQSLLHGSLINC